MFVSWSELVSCCAKLTAPRRQAVWHRLQRFLSEDVLAGLSLENIANSRFRRHRHYARRETQLFSSITSSRFKFRVCRPANGRTSHLIIINKPAGFQSPIRKNPEPATYTMLYCIRFPYIFHGPQMSTAPQPWWFNDVKFKNRKIPVPPSPLPWMSRSTCWSCGRC